MAKELIGGEYAPLKARSITEEAESSACSWASTIARKVHITPYFSEDGGMVAQKIRFPDKEFS